MSVTGTALILKSVFTPHYQNAWTHTANYRVGCFWSGVEAVLTAVTPGVAWTQYCNKNDSYFVKNPLRVRPHSVWACSMSEWKKRCAEEWSLQGAPMPDSQDWKSVYDAKPLGRNLLKNPSPHGNGATLETRLLCCAALLDSVSSSRVSVVLMQRRDQYYRAANTTERVELVAGFSK